MAGTGERTFRNPDRADVAPQPSILGKEIPVLIEPLRRGQERTYQHPGATIPIRCESQSTLVIAGMAQLTRWTVLEMPGARKSETPPQVADVLDDIIALRIVTHDNPWDAEAQRDVIAADLERHLHACEMELKRRILFGAYQIPNVPRKPDIDPCGFGGADVATFRSGPQPKLMRDSWLAVVVVPPQIARCTLVRPLDRCD
jgi:hypothetical protein